MKEITIAELRVIQLDILKHIDVFCKEHDIKYFLCGGSMIGAVRHQGFIPWDDDIDIMMIREDYNRFIQIYLQQDRSIFILHSHSSEIDYPYPYVKIEDSRTLFQGNVHYQFPIGIHIDLFPIDTVPESKIKQHVLFVKSQCLIKMRAFKNIRMSHSNIVKKLVNNIIQGSLSLISFDKITSLMEKNAVRYNGINSKYCGIVVWGYGMREINYRSNWDTVKYVAFEDIEAPIPGGYDNYLSNVYGDYMEPPLDTERLTHHSFFAYWK